MKLTDTKPTATDLDAITLPEGTTGIRTLTVPNGQAFTTDRNKAGRYAAWDRITLHITPRGHWYRSDDERDGFHNDTLCRGCGHHGHFDYILDYQPCTAPALGMDVVAALQPKASQSGEAGESERDPRDCPKAHRYQIFSAATGATSIPFETAQRARTLYDALPEENEAIWCAVHDDGVDCHRESQRQEHASMWPVAA